MPVQQAEHLHWAAPGLQRRVFYAVPSLDWETQQIHRKLVSLMWALRKYVLQVPMSPSLRLFLFPVPVLGWAVRLLGRWSRSGPALLQVLPAALAGDVLGSRTE